MKNVLITGVSGYIGSRVAALLSREDRVRSIAGTDIREPEPRIPGLIFIKRDIRKRLDDILHRHSIDTVVHTAFILPPIHNSTIMESVNLGGTLMLLESCARCGIRHLLYTSSSTAYGFHHDNEVPLCENSPLRGNDDFSYSRIKKMIERHIEAVREDNPDLAITVLRPCFVVGPGFSNPLAQHLQKRIVILPGGSHPLQFVHEDDLLEIIMLMLRNRKDGVYNVGSTGTLSFREMVDMLGNRLIEVKPGLIYVLNALAWKLRLTFLTSFPSPALNMVMHPWIVSSDKLITETGFRYSYTTREAFLDFARTLNDKKRIK